MGEDAQLRDGSIEVFNYKNSTCTWQKVQKGIQWGVVLAPTLDPLPLTSRSSFLCILLEICQVPTGTRKHAHRCFLLWKLEHAPLTAVHLHFWLCNISQIFPHWHAYGSTSFHLVGAYPLCDSTCRINSNKWSYFHRLKHSIFWLIFAFKNIVPI